jgi:hypothetical protein
MKKTFGIIALLLLASLPTLAAERGVVAEFFTGTN